MPRKTDDERFWILTDKGGPEDCWTWKGNLWGRGYGRFGVGGKSQMAHRWLYIQVFGPLPKGKQLDHLCRNRLCVNPAHLEPVTRKENILRGVCPSAVNARKTHCPQGHPLSGENLRSKSLPRGRDGVMRLCRTCQRVRDKRRNENGPGVGHYERTPQMRANISAAQTKRFARYRELEALAKSNP